MKSTMVVIKVARGLLTLAAIQQGVTYLLDGGVPKFNDKKYHVSVPFYVFADLLVGFSEHDALQAGFEVIVDDQAKKYLFAGLRWETNYESDVKIFGPKSNPDNPYVIDLASQEGQHDKSNDRSVESN